MREKARASESKNGRVQVGARGSVGASVREDGEGRVREQESGQTRVRAQEMESGRCSRGKGE